MARSGPNSFCRRIRSWPQPRGGWGRGKKVGIPTSPLPSTAQRGATTRCKASGQRHQMGALHLQKTFPGEFLWEWDLRMHRCLYVCGMCQCVHLGDASVCVFSYKCMCMSCVHLCAWRRQGSLEGPVGLTGWVTHTILSGLAVGAWVGVGEPWELGGCGSGPGSGSRSDGEPAPHTAS